MVNLLFFIIFNIVAIGITIGIVNKNKFYFSKQRSRHHSLLRKIMGKPRIRQVCENQILGSGIGYVWGRY